MNENVGLDTLEAHNFYLNVQNFILSPVFGNMVYPGGKQYWFTIFVSIPLPQTQNSLRSTITLKVEQCSPKLL